MRDLFGNDIPEPTQEERYNRYLSSARWRKKRDQALYRAGNKCERCGAPQWMCKELHVHHKTYERFMHEQLEDLVVLCPTCHSRADDMRRQAVERENWERYWWKRIDGWASKVYDWDWWLYPVLAERAEREFFEWLESKRG